MTMGQRTIPISRWFSLQFVAFIGRFCSSNGLLIQLFVLKVGPHSGCDGQQDKDRINELVVGGREVDVYQYKDHSDSKKNGGERSMLKWVSKF